MLINSLINFKILSVTTNDYETNDNVHVYLLIQHRLYIDFCYSALNGDETAETHVKKYSKFPESPVDFQVGVMIYIITKFNFLFTIIILHVHVGTHTYI